jgi:hypothetical protein
MPAEARYDISVRRAATIVVGRLRTLRRSESGFTLIEVLLAGVMLAILSVPISALLSTSAAIALQDRERTSADQIAQSQIENVRALPYFEIGLVNGNPQGNLPASSTASLPSIGNVTITRKVTFVSDPLPSNPYPTKADYKKVVITVTNASGNQLSTKTTYVAPASAPPNAGSTWIQIARTVVDAVSQIALSGASVNLTGGPDTSPVTNRNDTTDAAGNVLFPGLSTTANGTPGYTLATTLSGYNVFPDDLSPSSTSSVSSIVGNNTTGTIRLYKPVSLTVNLFQSNGTTPWTTGGTLTLDSSRCGKQSITVASGSSSAVITTCDTWNGKTINLPPNVSGQVPADDKYYLTMNSGANWGMSSSSGVLVPSSYPTTLTQTVNLSMSATTYNVANNKTITVTVKKSGTADPSARVEVTGGPGNVYLYGVTNASGQVSFTVPTTATAATYTINSNDMGVQKGTATTSVSSSTTSPIAVTVNIS